MITPAGRPEYDPTPVQKPDGRGQTGSPGFLASRARSFAFAGRGIAVVMRQRNAWIHAAATVAACSLAWALGITRFEWCWIVLAIAGVWAAEALNTAFELLADVASPDEHPIIGQAKDVAAAAVLMTALAAVVIGLLVFLPHLRQALAT